MLRILVLASLLAAMPAHADDKGDPFEVALSHAKARRAAVLVDFTAPWCYSCYYMKSHVLNGPEWEEAERNAVVIELDADSPVGARYMKEWRVKAMPTYLVFNAEGAELGRILGEQTRGDFYQWLAGATARANPLDALKDDVKDGSKKSVAAAREVLRAYHARYDAEGGLAWHGALPPAVQAALAKDAPTAAWLARLKLQQAAAAKDPAGCLATAKPVFAADLGCERPYELDKVLACTEGQPERNEVLRTQAKPMQALLDTRVLSGRNRCADERSVVLSTADLYAALGDAAAEKAALDRAVDDVAKRLGANFRKDRNLADNLRVYLERAQRAPELDQVLLKLIAAYPDDYVYAYRYGKILAARGEHEAALPFFEQAAAKAYGINKLRVAELRAKSLKATSRPGEARKVLAEALQANGPWFPEDAARLKAMMDQLPFS